MSNFLVIDFDMFFANPCEAGLTGHGAYQLFDWGHSETRIHVDGPVWPSRATSFWARDLPLPRCTVPPDFWSRFRFADDAEFFVADSNAYAGVVTAADGAAFDNVYLFDTHHDCYRLKTPADVWAFLEHDRVTCEDWMFVHLARSSQLHWRWPTWLVNGQRIADNDVPAFVELDAQMDDGEAMDVQFDSVFLCRSGGWVPPWCDDQFQDFLAACPLDPEFLQDDGADVAPRDWEPIARAMYKGWETYAGVHDFLASVRAG